MDLAHQRLVTVEAAKELAGSGIELSPGESIQYIITEEHAGARCDRVRPFVHCRGQEPYDAEKYIELLLRAVETVLTPLGIKYLHIEEWVKQRPGETERAQLYLPKKKVEYWGPLFEFAARANRSTR